MASKKMVILGTSFSGSGAVFDCLCRRADSANPLGGKEFVLPQMPNGLMTLHALFEDYFHFTSFDAALKKCYRQALQLGGRSGPLKVGLDYRRVVPNYEEYVKKYSSSIGSVAYRAALSSDVIGERPLDRIPRLLKSALIEAIGRPGLPSMKYLPSAQECFCAATKDLAESIIPSNSKDFVVVNQGGSGWSPHLVECYYENVTTVVVTRSPLDQYAELKKYKKFSGVRGLCDWYTSLQRHLENKISRSASVHTIRFEDFVLGFEESRERLCAVCGISPDVVSLYNPRESQKNINIYAAALSGEEVACIKNAIPGFGVEGYEGFSWESSMLRLGT